jgi:hypothetical protein
MIAAFAQTGKKYVIKSDVLRFSSVNHNRTYLCVGIDKKSGEKVFLSEDGFVQLCFENLSAF